MSHSSGAVVGVGPEGQGGGDIKADLGDEQAYVTMLYGRLDALRARAERRLSGLLRENGGTPQARSQRDSTAAMYAERVAHLDAVENGLCFGRLDYRDGASVHIGRIGIFDDEGGGYDPLLLDWRAPAARPFYVATAASPGGVTRRRHIRTRERMVVGLDDEVLDLDAAAGTAARLTGEAALLAALSATRTGHMRDIVETIQAEQDGVIRDDLGGILVVQGGPGTGKTAVALHRAAYLLYTYRRQLSARGVLIVGPNATFLRYISQVLPSLAETGVLLATLADLYPGTSARRAESAAVAEVKGRRDMVGVLAAAVRDRQRVPDEPIEFEVDNEVLRLDRYTCEAARHRARRSGRPHNLARPVFVAAVVDALAAQVAERIGMDPYFDDPLGGDDAPGDPNLLDAADLAAIRGDLAADPAVVAVLDDLWPLLTPQRLLADLFASDEALASAAGGFSATDRALLRRDPAGGWAPSDVPLLDEAAELLGTDDRAARARAARLHEARLEYAQGVLDIAAGSQAIDLEDDPEAEIANVADVLDAESLSDRYARGPRLTVAAHAATDRSWAFGHVIVDEAQEVTPMAWRLLLRRCPTRSMTVVGDLAQTGALGGPESWAEIFEPYVADRWRQAELTISYRTPVEVMAVAAEVLAGIDPKLEPPRSVRHSGIEPWDETGPVDRLADLVARDAEAVGDGRLAVIAPAGRLPALAPLLAERVPDLAVGERPELERTVVLLAVPQAKGLEFDGVIVVDPDGIVAESPRGGNDLYVALTRATQRLGVFRLM